MSEDEALDAYDFVYATLRRFVDDPLPSEDLSEESLAERAEIEEMAPEVIFYINSFISNAVFEPPFEENEGQSYSMELINKQTFKNASFVMAGGACLIGLFGHYLRIDGPLHVRGIQFITSLVIPTLCFWVGMLIRYKVGKPKRWVLAIAAVLMVAAYCYSFYVHTIPVWLNIHYQWWGLLLLGFILPWDYLYQHRDPDGIKSGILLLISALAYSVLDLVNERMEIVSMPAPVNDLGFLLASVTTIVLPLMALLPVYFAAEFSFSKAGQWLGSRKWYQVICWIAATIFFVSILLDLPHMRGNMLVWHLTQLIVQPVTVYLIIVVCRIIRKKEKTWKEVFVI